MATSDLSCICNLCYGLWDGKGNERGKNEKIYETMHYPNGHCFTTPARRHSKSPGTHIWLCHMGSLQTGPYHTLEQPVGGREEGQIIYLFGSFSSSIFHWWEFVPEVLTPLWFFFFFRACGSSWARGWIGSAAAGLCHSHCNTGSKPHLRPMLQREAMPYP